MNVILSYNHYTLQIRCSPAQPIDQRLLAEVVEILQPIHNWFYLEGRPGDRCSVEPYINCQQCYSCVRGHTNCCEKHQTLGVHCDGGLRPLFTVPARKLHVSRKLGFEQLALVETLAIGCHAVQRSGLQLTSRA